MAVVDELAPPAKPVSPDSQVLPVQQAKVLQSKEMVRGFRWGVMVLQLPLHLILVLEQGLDVEFVLHRYGKVSFAVIIAVNGFTQHLCAEG